MRRWACSAGFLLLAAGVARADVADYIGRPIRAVRFSVDGRDTTDASLSDVVETQVGRLLSVVDVRESVAHLYTLGRFEDVRADATLESGGVVLRYDLSRIHPVTSIEFRGQLNGPGIDVGALRQAVTDRYGQSPRLDRAADLERVVEQTLSERGYLHASARPRADIDRASGRTTLVFDVDPGVRTLVNDVKITGAPSVTTVELLSRLKLTKGEPYERDALNTRIDRYVAERRSRGYYEAKVSATPAFSDDGRTVDITLGVSHGPHVRVEFAGDLIPPDKRSELVPVEREGSVDQDLLEDASNAIEDFLRAQGYRDAKAPYSRRESDGELLITFTVTKGPEYQVERVEISGNASIPLAEFAPSLRLRAGAPFSDAKLDADVLTIENLYHRRGFASAKALPGPEPQPGDTAVIRVVVPIVIKEGVRTMVVGMHVAGNTAETDAALLDRLGLQVDGPFFAAQMEVDRETIESRCADLGFQSASVTATPGLSADGAQADVTFTVREGPRLIVDRVLIVGNVRTRRETILREMQLKQGDPIGRAAVYESRRRLAELGLFRRVNITQLGHGDEAKRDLLVTVEESPATTITYGAGGEVRLITTSDPNTGLATEHLEFAPRGSFSIGRRNLFGKNRSINLFTSVALHTESSAAQGTTEYQVVGTFREPRLFGTMADGFVRGVAEQQIRSSFSFTRNQLGANVSRRVGRNITLVGDYRIERTTVFNEQDPSQLPLIDRAFPQLRLSSFLGTVVYDTRDDGVDPTRGGLMSANGQIAARAIGSEVGFSKSFLSAAFFKTLPVPDHIVLAADARLGLSHGFTPFPDLPQAERFFAGGDTTVRGFALDTLGIPGQTLDSNGFPIGGNGLVIVNAELRVPATRNIQLVGFLDGGNVFARATDIDLTELRYAVGFGVRYKSPVGPIRVDLGFKVNRQVIAGQLESLTALHISFGQAF